MSSICLTQQLNYRFSKKYLNQILDFFVLHLNFIKFLCASITHMNINVLYYIQHTVQ